MAEYKDINELFQHWENDGYPDYVCGVWSTNGGMEHLTVAVNTESAQDEILELIENDSSVAFAYQKYSKNQLLSIIDEMNGRLSEYEYAESVGFVCMGLNEYDNRVDISFKIGFEEDTLSLALVNELTERFGDAVYFDYTEELIITDDLVMPLDDVVEYTVLNTTASNQSVVSVEPKDAKISTLETNLSGVCVILAISVLILVTAYIIQRKRLLSLAHGGTMNLSYSKGEIEDIIKNNSPDTSRELDDRVMEAVNRDIM